MRCHDDADVNDAADAYDEFYDDVHNNDDPGSNASDTGSVILAVMPVILAVMPMIPD